MEREREEHWKKIWEQVKGQKMKELLVVRKHWEWEEHKKEDRRTSEERENEGKERKNGKKENEGRIFFHFSIVPNMFPSMGSQYVP